MLGMHSPSRSAVVMLLPALTALAAVLPHVARDSSSSCTQIPVAMAWYTNWEGADNPSFGLANMNWTQYTRVSYSFLEPTAAQEIPHAQYAADIANFVQQAHTHFVNTSITIGGWTGSQYYSSAVATEQSRSNLVNASVDLVNTYSLDGLDFDWEYPALDGIGCNQKSDDDAANFLTLQELRKRLPDKTLSAAVSINPFTGLSDMSGFYDVLDYVEAMNYDVWGSSFSPSVGPNSPLSDSCAPSSDQKGSATSAVQAWSNAGFKADKIVLGVAGYGHSYSVTQQNAFASGSSGTLRLYTSFDKQVQPNGDSWDTAAPGTTTVDQCGNTQSAVTGIVNFWGMYQKNYLNASGLPSDGMDYLWDSCSQTPFLYDPNTSVMVSYDDPKSFTAKGQFIQQQGLRGWAMWEASSDYDNQLVGAIRAASMEGCSFHSLIPATLLDDITDM